MRLRAFCRPRHTPKSPENRRIAGAIVFANSNVTTSNSVATGRHADAIPDVHASFRASELPTFSVDGSRVARVIDVLT